MCETEERLPECETGSVERMLEAAIKWSERLEPRNSTSMPGFKVYECETKEPLRVAPSQTQLLRAILAKMETERAANICGGWRRHANCPNCGASIAVTLEFNKTTHG